MEALAIEQVARRAGVGIETVRFYERRGLIKDPPRTDAGYRQHPADVVLRLRFVKRAKELGFSLKEIAELLSLRLKPEKTCGDVKRRAEAKIADIGEKIRALQKMKRALAKLTAACDGRGPASSVPKQALGVAGGVKRNG